MFYLRGLLVSLSVFVVLYVVTSGLVCALWPRVQRRTQKLAPRWAAHALYALRIGPLMLSVAVVLGLCVPSFLRFEPHATSEAVGYVPVVLAAVFAVFAALNVRRAWNAYARTERTIRKWTRAAVPVASRTTLACFQVENNAPPVALVGISKPALVISAAAAAALSPREFSRTVEHELAHLRARDNLKKLLLHACGFPFMSGLERAWLQAVEYSADAEAVRDQAEALDLASALVKISRLTGCGALPELASGFVEGPGSLLQARVQRLIEWRAASRVAASPRQRFDVLAATLGAATTLVVSYPYLLKLAHAVTELLVR